MTGVRLLKGIAALIALVIALGAVAAETQTSNAGGVVVRVTPARLAPGVETWDFQVVFETHTAQLTGDPAQFTVLLDTQQRTQAALRWDGDPPGGHHRKGILRFKPIRPAPATITLKMRGVGGVPERAFTWSIAGQ
ncbi:MAG: hypothetical protein AB1560_03115 [Pseudomonadota bacterium]